MDAVIMTAAAGLPDLTPWDWTIGFLLRMIPYLHVRDTFILAAYVCGLKIVTYVRGCLLSENSLISHVCVCFGVLVLVVWCLAVICRCSMGYSETSVWSLEISRHHLSAYVLEVVMNPSFFFHLALQLFSITSGTLWPLHVQSFPKTHTVGKCTLSQAINKEFLRDKNTFWMMQLDWD